MAVVKDNVFINGISGKLGKQLVFKHWNGKTFVCVKSKPTTKESLKQKENRSKFKKASIFARIMMDDPAKKAEYKKIAKELKLPNAYTAAVTEYMRKPDIQEVDTTNYSGKANEEIKVKVKKKGFEVEEVQVIIMDKEGKVVEEGKAKKGVANHWIYSTLVDLVERESLQIIIRAKERTNNCVEKTFLKTVI